MKNIILTILLMLTSHVVLAHSGHDHASAFASMVHGVFYGSVMLSVVLGALMIKYKQNKKVVNK